MTINESIISLPPQNLPEACFALASCQIKWRGQQLRRESSQAKYLSSFALGLAVSTHFKPLSFLLFWLFTVLTALCPTLLTILLGRILLG